MNSNSGVGVFGYSEGFAHAAFDGFDGFGRGVRLCEHLSGHEISEALHEARSLSCGGVFLLGLEQAQMLTRYFKHAHARGDVLRFNGGAHGAEEFCAPPVSGPRGGGAHFFEDVFGLAHGQSALDARTFHYGCGPS